MAPLKPQREEKLKYQFETIPEVYLSTDLLMRGRERERQAERDRERQREIGRRVIDRKKEQ